MNSFHSNRGYALATVLIFSVLLSLTAAALLKYSGSEFRLNQRNNLRFQAKNGAEAMLEYGASEIMMRLQKNLNFSNGELTANPLTTGSSRKATLFSTAAGTYNNVASGSLNFWVSQYTEPTTRYIDPADPGNAYDPLRGQFARTQTIRLLASATSSVPGLSVTQYATQSIEIRDVALFNYAIFYNISMEVHPGPNMTITGPVHSNVDTYMTSNTSNTLEFLSTVTTAGRLINGALDSGRTIGRNVRFTNGLDINLNNVPDTIAINSTITNSSGTNIGTYVDTNLASRSAGNTFAQIASQVWRGNVQDSSMGIVAQNLPAISANNSAEAHTLIERPDSAGNTNLESQKYSNKAGLYIFQGANSGGTPPAPVAFKNATDAATYRALTAANRVTWLANAANKDKVVVLPSGAVKTNRRMRDNREGRMISTVDVDVGILRTAVNSTTSGAAGNIKAWNSTTSSYTADHNLDATVTRNGATDTAWNGTVYVDIENPLQGYTATSDIGSMGSGTGTRTAVRLLNGAAVPNRSAAVSGTADGFTLATNAAVYVVGNLNSPGPNAGTRGGTAVGTETVTQVNLPKDGEAPVAIVADAVNILSNAWVSGGLPTGDATSTGSQITATSTEISAAILTGNVATNTGASTYSGGVENFPRFHENWGSASFRYRGSMVALFNSQVATGPWNNATYGAPTRVWGFNQMFQQGRQPPGTPRIRSFRRVSFADLTKAQFDTLLANTSFNFTSM
jgi:hypothetical protein